MEFERENCKFAVPDRPTVRQQLEYFSVSGGVRGKEMLYRYWEGAKTLITDWECESMPDYKVSLDDIDSPALAEVIIWAGMRVMRFMNDLESIPKN